MKETFYFSHDYNATQDPKMIELLGECGLEGIGFYWILIEHLHADPSGRISEIQLKTLLKMYGGFHGGEHVFSKIQQVLNTTQLLLKDENGMFYSNRVNKHKLERQELSAKRAFAGKKSAEARANPTHVQQYKGKERKGKEIKDNTNAQNFEKFWKEYPRKENKETARKAFQKIDVSLLDLIAARLDVQKKSVQWQDKKYIPHAATWLNGKRWEDEMEKPKPKPGSPEYYLTPST